MARLSCVGWSMDMEIKISVVLKGIWIGNTDLRQSPGNRSVSGTRWRTDLRNCHATPPRHMLNWNYMKLYTQVRLQERDAEMDQTRSGVPIVYIDYFFLFTFPRCLSRSGHLSNSYTGIFSVLLYSLYLIRFLFLLLYLLYVFPIPFAFVRLLLTSDRAPNICLVFLSLFILIFGLCYLEDNVLASSSRVCRFNPGWSRWIFQNVKVLSTSSPGGNFSRAPKSEISGLLKNLGPEKIGLWAKLNRRIHVVVIP